MEHILEAIEAGAAGNDVGNLPIPEHFRAAYVQRADTAMFEGLASGDKDPAKSLRIGDVATPEMAPD